MLEMAKVIETVLARADLAPDGPPEQARLFSTALVPSRRASVVVRGGLGSTGAD
jgi:hypothetical protein